MTAHTIKLASYNIHGGIGADGHCVPKRIAGVLNELDADIVALQEVESRASGFDMLGYLRKETGLQSVAGPTRLREDAEFGNGLLSRLPIISIRRIDLCVHGCEPRGALDVVLDARGAAVRVLATHLGLRPTERHAQIRRLLYAIGSDAPAATILMGDINEWLLWGRSLRWLNRHFKPTPSRATFPARFPLFALDRIWVHPRPFLQRSGVHSSPLARCASDHLPATGEIVLPDIAASGPGAQTAPATFSQPASVAAREMA